MITKNADGSFSEERISIYTYPPLAELDKQIAEIEAKEAVREKLLNIGTTEKDTDAKRAIEDWCKDNDLSQHLSTLKEIRAKLEKVK